MRINQIKIAVIALIALPLITFIGFNTNAVRRVLSNRGDAAETYKTKCATCHSPKAEKFFDLTKTDEQLVEIIMKGKKGEKPPFMPGYEAKGMTAEEAKGLVVYMRQLRTPANTNANTNANVSANVNANANVNSDVNSNVKVNTNANVNSNVNANANVNANVNANTNVNATISAEIAGIYKTKCALCHTPKAEKFFDATKADSVLEETVLKGRKGQKPPYMPAFAEKGMTADQVKALVAYMKQLRVPPK